MNLSSVFNRNKLKNKSGKYTVNIRVNLEGKSDYLAISGFPKLEPKYWDESKKCVSSLHPFQLKLNGIIKREITKLEQFYIDQLDKGKTPNLQDIRYFYENQKERESFNLFVSTNIRKYIKKNELEHRTYQVYNTFKAHLDEFNPDIRFFQLTRNLVSDFNQFLLIRKKLNGTSRKKYFDKFKTMYREACKAGLAQYDEFLFSNVKIKVEQPKRVALTIEEIRKIRDCDLADLPGLQQARDEFLFLCYTGLYYSDLRHLKDENLIKTEKGFVITGERTKNGHRFIIPIYMFPQAIVIIESYRHTTEDEYLFPDTISDQKFNVKLKTLATAVGITKNLTNKVARHSFTDMMISIGVERQFVSKMLGHTKEATTQHYYDMNIDHIVNSKFGNRMIEL